MPSTIDHPEHFPTIDRLTIDGVLRKAADPTFYAAMEAELNQHNQALLDHIAATVAGLEGADKAELMRYSFRLLCMGADALQVQHMPPLVTIDEVEEP